MRLGLISKWAAASAVVLTALAAGMPASAGFGVANPYGQTPVVNRPAPSSPYTPSTSTSPYQLTAATRAALVPPGQTLGQPFVAVRGIRHANFSSETVLHEFSGPDGALPQGDIQQYNVSPVKLLGTASAGGSAGDGTGWSLKVSPLSFSDIHNFRGADGVGPVNLSGNGASYGVTSFGGANGMGAFFKMTPSGNVMVLHSFTGADGAQPGGAPLSFVDGCFYGTTSTAGQFGFGTIWQQCGSKFRTLHQFNENAGEGGEPTAGLSVAINGMTLSHNLYGTTVHGGPNGHGTIYSVNPSTGAVTTLFAFGGGPEGGTPLSELIPDFHGNLYSTTNGGGTFGIGTVFKFSLTSGMETVLFTFGSDSPLGAASPAAPLAFDAFGNLYGTTQFGGQPNQGGVVFVVPASGGYIQLWSFGNGNDGVNPLGPVLVGPAGALYGTTQLGGAPFAGTIWQLK